MSEPVAPATVSAATDDFSPDFGSNEVKHFGQEDGHATVAISRMLVIFFFYSLIIMGTVWFVVKSNWMSTPPKDGHGSHSETPPY